ncbi:MAG: succinate-semialdehyde dehydrogenase [Cupriavidus sp.]|nr:succinate-semialdehyde dehydrogenase [Cupriavidus sp.]
MHAVTESILHYNHGRDPERLTLKLAAIAADPFAFFRGTNHLYAVSLSDEIGLDAPLTYVCGDLHVENFGSFKGDNGLVYFDLNDFDDALVAPFTVDLVRMLSSVLVAGHGFGLSDGDARAVCDHMLAAYVATLRTGKPRWIERATAMGLVASLLRQVKRRKRGALLAARTTIRDGRPRINIDRRALRADKAQRERAARILALYSKSSQNGHRFVVEDVARRVAGVGSLGLERYVVLAHEAGDPSARRLIDIKRAAPSAWVAMHRHGQPHWNSDAQRVTTTQQIMQAASPALLSCVALDKRDSFLVKSLQPTSDRVDLAHCRDKPALLMVLTTMARAAAWAHLRGCGHQAADRIEALQDFAAGGRWQSKALRLARHGRDVSLAQWKQYAEDYRQATSAK